MKDSWAFTLKAILIWSVLCLPGNIVTLVMVFLENNVTSNEIQNTTDTNEIDGFTDQQKNDQYNISDSKKLLSAKNIVYSK